MKVIRMNHTIPLSSHVCVIVTVSFDISQLEQKLREMKHLEAEMAKECAARLEAEQNAEAALMNWENIKRLMVREGLDRQRPRLAEEHQARKLRFQAGLCRIL